MNQQVEVPSFSKIASTSNLIMSDISQSATHLSSINENRQIFNERKQQNFYLKNSGSKKPSKEDVARKRAENQNESCIAYC